MPCPVLNLGHRKTKFQHKFTKMVFGIGSFPYDENRLEKLVVTTKQDRKERDDQFSMRFKHAYNNIRK